MRVLVNSLLIFILTLTSTYSQNISFSQSSLNFKNFTPINAGTSLKFGPDERLYVSQLNGDIKVYTITRDLGNEYSVLAEETLGSIKSIPNYDDNGLHAFDKRGNRQITGITVVGTASNPVLYVTSSDPKWGGPSGDKGLDTNSGVISRITWTGSEWETVDLVRGLPRSEENHSINGIEFTQIKGKPFLLVAVGGFTNAGSPSKNFAYITEYALSAAILSVDLNAIEGLVTKVDPFSGRKYKYDIPTLDDPSRPNVNGIYNPNDPNYDGIDVNDPFGGNNGLNMGMIVEGGPVQIFSAGYRNSYDLVVTESGKVYATDNGANINWGGLPENEGNPALVSNRYLPAEPGGSPLNKTASGEYVDNRDHLLMITSNIDDYQFGGFYGGHPTPIRANPGSPYVKGAPFPFDPQGAGLYTHFSIDGVLPSFTPVDFFRTKILEPVAPGSPGFNEYAATSLPANWPPVPAIFANPAEADFIAPSLPNSNGPQPVIVTPFPNNSNGIDEYKASNFGGVMKGSLIVGKNEGQLHLINLNEDGSLKSAEFNKFNLNGGNALGIACNGDSDIFPGTIWVATFDNRIVVLTPADNVICIDVEDPDFDPNADYDFDGYTNQDELDNGSDYCSGASVPNDYDRDFVSDLNDLDDDGDGILDEDDPFQLGDPRDLPINNELFTNQRDNRDRENGYLGLGLTGFMNNGAPNPNWMNWLDKGDSTPGPPDIYGGTAGAIQVSMTGGTANGSVNTQEKGFQFGVNVSNATGPFSISSGLIGLSSPGQLYDFDGNGEVGIQMGDGTQSNFIKLVFTHEGLLVSQENNDLQVGSPILYAIPTNARPDSNTLIELSFDVDPVAGTVKPFVKFGEDTRIQVAEIMATGRVLQAIQQSEIPLAIGIYGTSNDWSKSFIGVWNFFRVSGEQPFVIRSLPNFSRLFDDPDLLIDLSEYFDDNGGVDNLVYSIVGNSNQKFEPSINGELLTVGLPNDAVSTNLVVRATDLGGYFIEQTFSVTVEQDKEVILRINAGGPLIPDQSGGVDWLANSVNGAFQTEFYKVSSGSNSGHSFDPANRHASIPTYISDALYTAIFSRERYNQGGGQMVFEIPVPDGDYTVNLYMGNGFDGTANVTNRVFSIMIEDELVESNLDLVARYGHRVGAMQQYPVRVTDGAINITFINNIQSPLVNAIEIWGKPIQTPILVEPVGDQLSFMGEELDGSLFVKASGGDGQLSYKAVGLPPGLDIEPTNGTIYGVIAENAIGNSPYRVTITVDDSDEISSDAVSFNFNWTISPPISQLNWNVKNESTAYTARHENAFVQAGDRFYLMGGRENALTIDVYDYSEDRWEALVNVSPHPFNHFQATEYKGLIWVIGAFKSNNFPNEVPAEHVWAFDPVAKRWIQGPEIPESRRRGSAGLVLYNDKFYVISGNKLGHEGGAVNYFDEFDPATGRWRVLADAPRARDHFYATVVGNNMYVVGGRTIGGPGGVFGPLIQQIDVYNFAENTWSTLDPSKNIPTPRAGAITNNYFNKVIIAGGETPTPGPALATTEVFDPVTQEWEQISNLNFPRHGTQGIVSGNGLYVAAGSPNRGGGQQRNMEYFGFDQPKGSPLRASELVFESTINVKAGERVKVQLEAKNGNQAIYIRSIKLINDNQANFALRGLGLEHAIIQPNGGLEFELEYIGTELENVAQLEITKGDMTKEVIDLVADGTYEEINLYLNTGSINDVLYEGELFLSDTKFNSYFNNSTSTNSNVNASAIPIFQSHRFGPQVSYTVPVPNGIYRVTTYHNETYFGINGPAAQPGRRVFSISLEGQVVKSNLDLFIENGNRPVILEFSDIEVTDGFINLDMVASVNNATISALSIQNQGRLNARPVPRISVSESSGSAPLQIQFDGSGSEGQGQLSYVWDFGDGTMSVDPSPVHTFENPGTYGVLLTVQDQLGRTASESIEITVVNPALEFGLYLNTGTNATVSYQGVSFVGDSPLSSYYGESFSRTNTAVSDIPLYQSHRFATTLNYSIPVPNGVYTIKTYHNEFYFGKTVSNTGPGRRVFDIFLEGQRVKQNFDLFVEASNQSIELVFENVLVSDGILNLDLIASANSASISGISIELVPSGVVLPVAIAVSSRTSGTAPLTVQFEGSGSSGQGDLTYNWQFGNLGQSSEMNPSFVFSEPGTYEVVLTVTDGSGRSSSSAVSVMVSPPIGSFTRFINTGASTTVQYLGNTFVAESQTPGIYSESFNRVVSTMSSEPLFQSHRFFTQLHYEIPVPNGTYTVQTHHNEFYFGKTTATTGSGRRVFDILLEGQLVKDDFDIFVESNNQPITLTFTNVMVTDGVLNLSMIASANNASISGISIISENSFTPLKAVAESITKSGVVPLVVAFNGGNSTGEGPLDFHWDFGDGTSSDLVAVTKIYTIPGVYPVTLTVSNGVGEISTASLEIAVLGSEPLSQWHYNTGSGNTVTWNGIDYVGDLLTPSIYSSNSTYSNTAASSNPLFQTERFAANLAYSIPVENGIYTVKTYHNELWFGKRGPAAAPGLRVFDIFIEGQLLKDNFDIYVEGNNEPTEIVFEGIIVSDGKLDINMVREANNANISGLSIVQMAALSGNERVVTSPRVSVNRLDIPPGKDQGGLATLYPNPSRDFVTLDIPASLEVNQILVSDMQGRIVSNRGNGEILSGSVTIGLESLSAGVYTVHLVSDSAHVQALRLLIRK
ncbi:MAG: PKD domain-containing protein [Lunatimonas sp.]|uniref:malectin domain-containing carbohydrate-binding protein n=1 Tax=Lunatimonas sp. TaxID=2060141 RepID=UPI00263AE11C|nr:malectin domain-containing carbohydrate-binding protein [Lunatimonas sp.]MCC5936490.1 PKD domain-containing protein [Lunatimonas sp.]